MADCRDDDKSDNNADGALPRRRFLLGAGTAVAAGMAPGLRAQTAPGVSPLAQTGPGSAGPETLLVLTAPEAAFFSAAADSMIPADELTPSGTDCGIVNFIDRQLAGAWGGGAKMYRSGPHRSAKREYGYQLPMTPKEFFSAGIVAANAWTRKTWKKDFDRLAPQQRIDALTALEAGKADLGKLSSRQFFEALLNLVMEGFFADPMYGGNRDKVAWKMVGFPGLPALYANLIVQYRDKRYAPEPKSIADFS
jgi:gluconate 2-dehydrogenase gamma chain